MYVPGKFVIFFRTSDLTTVNDLPTVIQIVLWSVSPSKPRVRNDFVQANLQLSSSMINICLCYIDGILTENNYRISFT